jgi:hypothetical protein
MGCDWLAGVAGSADFEAVLVIELCRWRCRRYWVVGGGGGGGLWWWCGWLGCGMGCDWLEGVAGSADFEAKKRNQKIPAGASSCPCLRYALFIQTSHHRTRPITHTIINCCRGVGGGLHWRIRTIN